ncbi:siderophore-interacting protein [Xanthobacter autotrophicus]|uniref:siderophore-interacting protein n=1 Tax=Xanthobacter TaxID=279 RepID=UPI0024AA5F47|nr:siderophore-interacting protein [Xanthobacter autotrophicus]MDI4664129.1 siderophore-interacting protein [Xanthobacter autotrophicus]
MNVLTTTEPRAARYRGIRVLEVLRAEQITPRLRRIVLGGAEIEGFGAGPNIKLLIPPEGVEQPEWPLAGADGRAIWPAEGFRPAVRTFSVRRFDPLRGELSVDFACHGGHGPAARFAARARPGDLVGIGGPGGRTLPPADFHILAGDHCGLPSIAAILESLPPQARGAALLEVEDEADALDLDRPTGMSLAFLYRRGAPAGTTSLLADAIRTLELPEGSAVSAWIAAESAAVRAARTHLVSERGVERAAVVAIGYWKRGISEPDYDAAYRHDREEDPPAG